jgi:hypothetical protein
MRRAQTQRARPGRRAIPALLRLVAGCLALLLAAAPLEQIAHFILVPHAVCVEHGDLIELAHDDGHGEHAAAPLENGAPSPIKADSRPSSSHDHCELLASAQRQATVPNGNGGALLAPAIPLRTSIERSPPAALPRILSLAPKTSPPAALS